MSFYLNFSQQLDIFSWNKQYYFKMAGECSLVNLTASSSITWIIDLVLQQQQGTATQQQDTYELNLKTKYYTAAVKLKHLAYSDAEPGQISDKFDETEALLIYCDGTKECLSRADRVWAWAKEHNPAICLFIIDTTKDSVDKDGDEVTRTEIMTWCLANNFELVECDEVDESDPDGVADIVGKDRILEALKSHTWSTMELIEPSQQKQGRLRELVLFLTVIIHV